MCDMNIGNRTFTVDVEPIDEETIPAAIEEAPTPAEADSDSPSVDTEHVQA